MSRPLWVPVSRHAMRQTFSLGADFMAYEQTTHSRSPRLSSGISRLMQRRLYETWSAMTMTDVSSHPMPDMQMYVLPGRAYLLSIRDQNLPMRRAALVDARAMFDA